MVTYSKITQVKVESNDRYCCLRKSKKEVVNLTAEVANSK